MQARCNYRKNARRLGLGNVSQSYRRSWRYETFPAKNELSHIRHDFQRSNAIFARIAKPTVSPATTTTRTKGRINGFPW